nr:MAG TPA: hypothetical protein [Caudoviricetes sp.]
MILSYRVAIKSPTFVPILSYSGIEFKYFLFFTRKELTLFPPSVIMWSVEANSTSRGGE